MELRMFLKVPATALPKPVKKFPMVGSSGIERDESRRRKKNNSVRRCLFMLTLFCFCGLRLRNEEFLAHYIKNKKSEGGETERVARAFTYGGLGHLIAMVCLICQKRYISNI
ncbi:hypothetical protein AAHE18_05G098200 [Arachis hypogaea]